MQIIAILGLVLFAINTLATPFLFGQERKPYNPTSYVIGLLLALPFVYLYWQVILAY